MTQKVLKFFFQILTKKIYGTITFKSISVFGITVIDPRFTTFVLMKMADVVIIGHPLMEYLGIVLNFNKDRVIISDSRR